MTQFAEKKSKKKISNFLTQKNSITSTWVTPDGKKSKKIFFRFLAPEWPDFCRKFRIFFISNFSKTAFLGIFYRKRFKIHASNFAEMFIGPLSTTFVKTVWRFSHIDGSQIKKTAISYKKNHFFLIFVRNTLDAGFKLSRNVYWTIIYNFW